MPIKPENAKLYPPNWREIVERVRERSGNRCEGSPAYPDCRVPNGALHPVTGGRVTLTTGHLDHDPPNVAMSNLRHWCNRCHVVYDARHHAETAYRTRKAAAATMDLFALS